MNGSRITEPADVLDSWATHFPNLGESRCPSNHLLDGFMLCVAEFESNSYRTFDLVLDSPISAEEVDHAIIQFKATSAGRPDSLTPHYPKLSGPLFQK